jgi:hypothetical protein
MSGDRLQTSHTDVRKSCQGEARHVEPRGDEQAKGSGWLPEYSETLRGGNVILCGDNDHQGRQHMRIVAGRRAPRSLESRSPARHRRRS